MNLLGGNIDYLAYPYGDIDRRVVEASIKAGYVLGASVKFGINTGNFNLLRLSRTDIWAYDNIEILKKKINGFWDWMRWMHRMGWVEEVGGMDGEQWRGEGGGGRDEGKVRGERVPGQSHPFSASAGFAPMHRAQLGVRQISTW